MVPKLLKTSDFTHSFLRGLVVTLAYHYQESNAAKRAWITIVLSNSLEQYKAKVTSCDLDAGCAGIGHTVTCELKTGEMYRGHLMNCEDGSV
eukprot:2193430-Amphidinium_carterae.1